MIAVVGAFGKENFGDDALMTVAYDVVNRVRGDASLVVVCDSAGYASHLLPAAEVVTAKASVDCAFDTLVYGGGTQFYSFRRSAVVASATPWQRARAMADLLRGVPTRTRRLFKRLFGGQRRPGVVALGIGLGPFVSGCPRMRAAQQLMTRAQFLAVRDAASYALCREWGCDQVILGADLCFLPSTWDDCLAKAQASKRGAPQRIGVVLRDWPHTMEGSAYGRSLLDACRTMKQTGRQIQYVLFSPSRDAGWAGRLRALGEDFVEWQPQAMSIQDFLATLAQFDIIVTARYHGAVFAALLGIPVVCIEVEQKLRLVSELLGEGSRLWTWPFNVADFKDCLNSIDNNYAAAVIALEMCVGEQRRLAEKMIARFNSSCAARACGEPLAL